MYHTVKKLGIPDSHIILMLGDDVPCNVRNLLPATLYNNQNHSLNLYGDDVEVDYRGYDVTVENFLRLLTGRQEPGTPARRRLGSDAGSNVLIFMSGHGGDEFLKFQDATEVTNQDMRETFWQMWAARRYHSVLFMVETCQAATLVKNMTAPGIVSVGSSLKDENSYSHHNDAEVGLHVIDRFTYHLLERLNPLGPSSSLSMLSFLRGFQYRQLMSHVYWDTTHPLPLSALRVMDFLATRSKAVRTADVAKAPDASEASLPMRRLAFGSGAAGAAEVGAQAEGESARWAEELRSFVAGSVGASQASAACAGVLAVAFVACSFAG